MAAGLAGRIAFTSLSRPVKLVLLDELLARDAMWTRWLVVSIRIDHPAQSRCKIAEHTKPIFAECPYVSSRERGIAE